MINDNDFVIKDLLFKQTCGLCPEQYDVYRVNTKKKKVRHVGYIRIRHGILFCSYPNAFGKTIFYKDFKDGRGCLYSGKERIECFDNIAKKILFHDSWYMRFLYSIINFFLKRRWSC